MAKFAKRWSAVSDGGEDQGAEDVTVIRQKKAKNHHVSLGKSRLARAASLFQLTCFALRSTPFLWDSWSKMPIAARL